MWSKFIFLSSFVMISCSSHIQTNDKKSATIERQEENRCYELSADHIELAKLSSYFNITFDRIEKEGGVYVYFELSNKELTIAYWSNPNNIIEKIEKINESTFYITKKNIYIGIKNFRKSRNEVIWLAKSKETLFDEENSFGTKIQKTTTCIDRIQLKKIYEERVREVGTGPDPDGANPEKLKKIMEETQKRSK